MKLGKMKKAVLATAIIVVGTTGAFAHKPEKMEGFRGHNRPFAFAEKQVMGTISAVNADAQTIILTDADGKNRKIHINPLTNICKIDPKGKRDKAKKDEPPFNFERLELENLQPGQWITVQKFNTDTETIEAWNIAVHRNKRAMDQAAFDPDAK